MMTHLQWIHAGMLALIASLFLYVLRVNFPARSAIRHGAWLAHMASLVCLVTALVLRSTEATFFALSNMFESMLVLCIGVQAAFLILDRWFNLPALGWPVCLVLLAALGYDLTLPTDIAPLQAALQSYWRSIHVPVIIGSYALFTLAFISSVVYLAQEALRKPGNGSLTPVSASGPTLDADIHPMAALPTDANLRDPALKRLSDTGMARQLDNVYDEITYRCVAFGFPLLAIGIILGGLWANEAWGNYWSWDPKESMSLVTLLAYGVYLHLRVNGEHSPKTLAWVSIGGFIMMLVTYFGVNIMGVGLHSYGKIG